ncbi:hypothetical protein AVEN_266735-1 [Araneus ventricosus]|uniref:DDE Tnp4 domain-containing protein n=1 Tax=Araneus ventricosus TaxID=182803 RepID=A0A4Y2S123_ARAVE|nr:hypothetical protein AVEN_266735-1 [Araneus ventricosus]
MSRGAQQVPTTECHSERLRRVPHHPRSAEGPGSPRVVPNSGVRWLSLKDRCTRLPLPRVPSGSLPTLKKLKPFAYLEISIYVALQTETGPLFVGVEWKFGEWRDNSVVLVMWSTFKSTSSITLPRSRLLKQEAVPIIFSKTPKQMPRVGLPSSATDGNNMQPDGTKQMNKLKDELKELQNSLGEKAFISENISNDTKMKAPTGFTIKKFSCIYSFLNVEEDLQTRHFCKRPVDLFFLFLVKLRTGISNEFLSVLFEISDSTVSRYFTFVTTVLYEKLKLLHIFPSKSKVESMPRQFYSENRDCRVIVDCTEIPIQKPNSPAEQQMTFSFYKNTNTLKGMIGIMPSGTISFISPLYCGSISDKELFIKSQLMDLLEPNDVVMADKGFQIEQEFKKISCKLKYPNFLKDCIQLDASDRIENCKISNVRVTVERTISQIKIYKYFERPIP